MIICDAKSVKIILIECEDSAPMARSQAKRLIRRFNGFTQVTIDFEGINEIGQAFADELFRVYKIKQPNIEIIPINMSENVKKMVCRAGWK